MMPTDGQRGGYVLEWLDNLVSVTLKPAKKKTPQLLAGDVDKLHELVVNEKNKVQTEILSTIFSLKDEAKITCTIKKYHSNLIALLDQALEDQAAASGTRMKRALEIIIVSLDELLALIEQRFTNFLGIDERVPATYFERSRTELYEKLAALSDKIGWYDAFKPAFDIMKQEILNFLNPVPVGRSYTFRELLYLTDLTADLGGMEPAESSGVFSALDEVLIGMNFNSSAYIQYLTQRLATSINEAGKEAGKMETILLYRKQFNQLHRKPVVKFLLKEANLYSVVENWFEQEMYFLERNNHYVTAPIKKSLPSEREKERQKIKAKLSVDQLALILRAADDLRIIEARSLSSIFKSIAPYLSTPQKEDISADSMRSKAYSAELRDREVAIQTLQQLMDRIKEY